MRRLRPLLFVSLISLLALSVTMVSWADDDDDHCARPETLPFSQIEFFFELNETDEDLGIQLDLGADPWRRLKILDPRGRTMLDVSGKGRLRQFGLSQLFFESAEPSFEQMSREEILERFPEGTYTFIGRTVEGNRLLGTRELSHGIPVGPEISSPADGAVVDPYDVQVTWLPVTPPTGVEIAEYQVIVTNEENSRFRYDVRLPEDATSLRVPAEFFESDTEYELEVLAVADNGNQTITVQFFHTE